MQEFDFVVVGAGIAGLSTACELAALGSVAVFETEAQPGLHTTGRSASVFIDSYGNEAVQKLSAASRPFFEAPPAGFTELPLLTRLGGLMVASKEEADALHTAAAMITALYPGLRILSCEEALQLVPFLSTAYLGGAVLDPNVGSIDVSALQQGYIRGTRERGGQILTDQKVSAVERSAGRWTIGTQSGEFNTPTLINAAGAWADEVALLAGVAPVGLVPKRRTVVVFDPPEGMEVGPWPIVGDIAEQFYFKPESGRILACPYDATPMPPCDPDPDDLDVATAMDHMERVSGHRIPAFSHKWAGLRSFVKDESPVLGRDPEADGFYWCAALGGFGVQTSPAAGRIAAAHAAGKKTPEDIRILGLTDADVSPRRTAISA